MDLKPNFTVSKFTVASPDSASALEGEVNMFFTGTTSRVL